jgi:ParB-like chromosome segregation protein Spo0J
MAKNITENTLAIVYRNVEELVPYANNARRHDNLKELEANIRRFGFLDPIGVDGAGTIVWGHGRLLAAKNVGLETVPVIELPAHLSAEEIRAVRLAHNKLTETSGWMEDILAQELRELADLGQAIDLLGWDDSELEKLTREMSKAIEQQTRELTQDDDEEDDEDDEEEKPAKVVELGDPKPAAGPEASPADAPQPLPPGERYVEFSLVLREAERDELVEKIKAISSELGVDDDGAALLHVVRNWGATS